MAVRNGDKYLPETLDSVFGQSFEDFECLVVDDASTDGTVEMLEARRAADPRLRIFRNDASIGPYPAANRALEHAQAPLVARIDADDICRSDRFARQVAFMEAHPDHLLVGSGYRSIDGEGQLRYVKPNALDDAAFRWISRFRMPIVHPSFCFRATYPDGSPVRYREAYPVAQDFALACDLLAKGKAASLADPLIDYRMHDDNISSTRRAEQNTAAVETALRHLATDAMPEVAERFTPFLHALYAADEPDSAAFRSAVHAFRQDLAGPATAPAKRWRRRRAAGMLAEAFLRGRAPAARLAGALRFLWLGPDFVLPLAARVLEAKGLLAERSDLD